MSIVVRTFNASVNIPKPTVSASFDSQVESFLSKAIATGDTDRIHGVIRGFRIYPSTTATNTVDIVPSGTSVAILRKSNTEFLYTETERTYSVSLNAYAGRSLVFVTLVPDFERRRISIVLYDQNDYMEMPKGSIILCAVPSIPEAMLPGNMIYYSGSFFFFEQAINFERTVYDPSQNIVRRYTETFANTSKSPTSWVTSGGNIDLVTDPQLGGSGLVLIIEQKEPGEFAIQFPHVMTPYYDFRGEDLVNANNKIRAKIEYSTGGEFSYEDLDLQLIPASGEPTQLSYPTGLIPTAYPSTTILYADFSIDPESQVDDRNYRLRMSGIFSGKLNIHSVTFEVELDPSGTFTENVIVVPAESGGGGAVLL